MGQRAGDNKNHQQSSQSYSKSISSKGFGTECFWDRTANTILKAWICWSCLGISVKAGKNSKLITCFSKTNKERNTVCLRLSRNRRLNPQDIIYLPQLLLYFKYIKCKYCFSMWFLLPEVPSSLGYKSITTHFPGSKHTWLFCETEVTERMPSWHTVKYTLGELFKHNQTQIVLERGRNWKLLFQMGTDFPLRTVKEKGVCIYLFFFFFNEQYYWKQKYIH